MLATKLFKRISYVSQRARPQTCMAGAVPRSPILIDWRPHITPEQCLGPANSLNQPALCDAVNGGNARSVIRRRRCERGQDKAHDRRRQCDRGRGHAIISSLSR